MTLGRLTPLLVGQCPDDWQQVFVDEVTELLTNGYVGPSLPYQTNDSEIGVRYLQGFNVRPNKIDFMNATWVTKAFHERNQKSCLREGDLLVVQSGHIGTAAVVPAAATGSNCHALIINRFQRNKVDPYFVCQYINSEIGQARLRGLEVGSSMLHINTSELGRFILPLPPLAEQRRLAEILGTWDAAIDKTEQLIAAKLKRNEILSNQLLFGHARFRQRNTQTTRALHWFSAPSDWQVMEIGQVASEVSALNGSNSDLPVLSCTKYDGLVDSLKYFDKQVFSHDTSKYKVVRHGQFAYATNHIEEGSIGYQNLTPAGLVSPIYTVFQSDAKRIDDGYFYKLLKTEKLRQIFSARTNSSVDRRGSLRWKDFARIHIPLPPVDEQREINAVLDDAKCEIALLQAEVKALKTQKRGLMQKLLTGQWRLPVHAEAS
jgi:type I restriction enzyme S subunit